MAHDAFISYSSKDKLVADAVCAALEKAGLTLTPADPKPTVNSTIKDANANTDNQPTDGADDGMARVLPIFEHQLVPRRA